MKTDTYTQPTRARTFRSVALTIAGLILVLAGTARADAQVTVDHNVSDPYALANDLQFGGPVWFALYFGADRVNVNVAPGDYYGLVLDFTIPVSKEVVIRADAPIYSNPEDYCDQPIVRIVPDPSGVGIRNWIHSNHKLQVTVEGLTFEGWNGANTPPYTSAFNIDGIETSPGVFDGCAPVIRHCGFQNNDFGDTSNFFQISGAMLSGPGCDTKILDCCFRDNLGHSAGGAIWIYGIEGTSSQTTRHQGDREYYPDFEIRNCVFERNALAYSGSAGGAINLTGTRGVIANCEFSDNTAGHGGGAIYGRYTEDTVIEGNTFTGNGLATDPAVLAKLQYDGRTAIGGAIYMNFGATHDTGTVVRWNEFLDNRAVRAGAVCLNNGSSFITNNRFVGNSVAASSSLSATASAVGIRVSQPFSTDPPDPGQTNPETMIVNNLFADNEVEGGISTPSDDLPCTVRVFSHLLDFGAQNFSINGLLVNNTFTGNADRSVTLAEQTGSSVSLGAQNNVFVSNGTSVSDPLTGIDGLELFLSSVEGGLPTASGQNNVGEQLAGPLAGPSNFALLPGDPLFLDPSQDDYSLATGSPAIDAGQNILWSIVFASLPQVEELDLAGDARLNGNVDIGCHEVN